MLEDKFGIPVYINNDGDLFVYSDAIAGFLPYVNGLFEQAGSPKRYCNLFGITLGTGVRGGIAHNGEMFTGDNSVSFQAWLLRNKLNPGINAEEGACICAVRGVYAQCAGIPDDQAPGPEAIFDIGMGLAPSNHGLGDERSRSSAAVAVATLQPPGKRAGTRLAVVGNGATLWVLAGGVGAPVRPQRELGVAALGAGRVAAGNDPAASTRRKAGRATGHEVSGAGGASQRGGLHADGCRFRAAPLRYAASGATLCRLARGLARGPRAYPRRAGTVFKNAAAAAIDPAGRGRTGARSGDGGGPPASSGPAAGRSPAGDGWPATGTSATPDRKRATGTRPDGGANGEGTRSQTC